MRPDPEAGEPQALAGRVAVITGAGRGLGREYALLFGRLGASVVVNDMGGASDGAGADASVAEAVAEEIRASGGLAVAHHGDVADLDEAQRLIDLALDTFSGLHVVVNNAGFVRDRMLVNMDESEWDSVIRVHLKGHFATLRAAARHWRQLSKTGVDAQASVINTTSVSGLFGNVGQASYVAAKAGIAALGGSLQQELGRYGVRLNTIAPGARTRLSLEAAGGAEIVKAPDDQEEFDEFDPANVAPLVAYLASASCPLKGQILLVKGREVEVARGWSIAARFDHDDRWTIPALRAALESSTDGATADLASGRSWASM